jgi:hypothetical protein
MFLTMSSIDFAPIRSQRPDLNTSVTEVSRLLASHHRLSKLNPIWLSRQLCGKVDSSELISLLDELHETHMAQLSWGVVLPSGNLADEEFESPRDIPEYIFDEFDRLVKVDQSLIVPIYTIER